jgi:hypothetical protein
MILRRQDHKFILYIEQLTSTNCCISIPAAVLEYYGIPISVIEYYGILFLFVMGFKNRFKNKGRL